MEAGGTVDRVESIQLDADQCQRQLPRLSVGQARYQYAVGSGSVRRSAVRDYHALSEALGRTGTRCLTAWAVVS